jgi:hypothetical protein
MFGKTEQLKEEEMKQTAVEWLINELDKYNKGVSEFFPDVAIKNHATRIHKEQMIESGNKMQIVRDIHLDTHIEFAFDPEQYYNENYGGGE